MKSHLKPTDHVVSGNRGPISLFQKAKQIALNADSIESPLKLTDHVVSGDRGPISPFQKAKQIALNANRIGGNHLRQGVKVQLNNNGIILCDACQNTGRAYWSDGVSGPCLQCYRGGDINDPNNPIDVRDDM